MRNMKTLKKKLAQKYILWLLDSAMDPGSQVPVQFRRLRIRIHKTVLKPQIV